jgi:hypothetical protein
MSVINNNLLLTPEGYQISRSVRLRSSASAYFNRTPASAGDRQKYTWSGWIKRGALPSSGNIGLFTVGATDAASDGLIFSGAGTLFLFFANATYSLNTSAILRDPSAWYHIVFSVDTTQATAANRVSLYVNGVQVTSFSAASYPTQNYNCYFNSAAIHAIGRQQQTSPSGYFDGYLTEVNFIDGQALTPSSFGETDAVTGVWKPKKYAGTYGTNGFYLNFSDNSAATAAAIGKDNSGNGNNWTPNNISVTAGVTYDSMIDVPTMWADGGNGRGNYCTLNPLNKNASSITVLNGNLGISTSASNVGVAGTIGVSSDKWYWETTFTNASGVPSIGAATASWDKSYAGYTGSVGYHGNGVIYNNGSNVQSGLASYTSGDVIGVALDLGAGSIAFYKNNVQQGTTITGLTGEWFPAVAGQTSSTLAANFGQRPFAYTPPTGFKALNTQNLPDAAIKKGNAYFDATTYTGNGGTQSVVNSGGFQPDLVWGKSRSAATENAVYDAVRGSGLYLITNTTGAEANAGSLGLSSFNSNGFSLGSGTGLNANGATYVGWQWKESASAGFDIVTYTGTAVNGQTFAHSLGVAPSMIIIKGRSAGTAGGPWYVYHKSTGATNLLRLNTTAAAASDNVFNYTAPTASVFTLGAPAGYSNASGETYVAYLFAEVAGFSKFGSYTGNGSADGPFVYLGFKPRFVMVKRTDAAGEPWAILDTARDTINASGLQLKANASDAEDDFRASFPIDFTSNGFKIRNTGTRTNASGGTYIFAAFAESPFKNSLAR